MEAVTLTNISKRYGSVEALRGVSPVSYTHLTLPTN